MFFQMFCQRTVKAELKSPAGRALGVWQVALSSVFITCVFFRIDFKALIVMQMQTRKRSYTKQDLQAQGRGAVSAHPELHQRRRGTRRAWGQNCAPEKAPGGARGRRVLEANHNLLKGNSACISAGGAGGELRKIKS